KGRGSGGRSAKTAGAGSRLYLKRATRAKDEEPDPNLRILEVMKNNYGPVGETFLCNGRTACFCRHPHREAGASTEGRRPVPDIAGPLEGAGPQRQRQAQGQRLRAGPFRGGTGGQGRPGQ